MPRWRSLARRVRWPGSGGGNDWGLAWVPDPGAVFVVDDRFGLVVGLLAAVVCVLLFWWIVVPLLLAVVDVVVVIALVVGGIVVRVVFRRPWVIEAESADGRRYTRRVVGWRAACAELSSLAVQISTGSAEVLRLPGSAVR